MTGRWGLTYPLQGISLADHGPILQEAENIGYTDAWSAEGAVAPGSGVVPPGWCSVKGWFLLVVWSARAYERLGRCPSRQVDHQVRASWAAVRSSMISLGKASSSVRR